MIAAVIGDIVGSAFERQPIKTKDFPLFSEASHFTDDTVMSLALAEALMRSDLDSDRQVHGLAKQARLAFLNYYRSYPDLDYGTHFRAFLEAGAKSPYGSYGNGAAMRISAVGLACQDLAEAKSLSYEVTALSHNHPEAIRGAEALTVAIFLARRGFSKQAIRRQIERDYYRLDRCLDEIRPSYGIELSCQASVPEAIQSFLEAEDFEDAIRNAVSLGGDSDTLASMAAAIAGAYFPIPITLRQTSEAYLDRRLRHCLDAFEARYPKFLALAVFNTFSRKSPGA
ncbi:MAG: ADP-ribosylglycohydrolase family protein [Eubacteriales bacterium]|nr:ADP-ribosylglycohydrolase family protein [Eubacteriales bacterium]